MCSNSKKQNKLNFVESIIKLPFPVACSAIFDGAVGFCGDITAFKKKELRGTSAL
jgi:hypothetical protein